MSNQVMTGQVKLGVVKLERSLGAIRVNLLFSPQWVVHRRKEKLRTSKKSKATISLEKDNLIRSSALRTMMYGHNINNPNLCGGAKSDGGTESHSHRVKIIIVYRAYLS